VTTLTVASFNVRNGRAFDGLNSWPFRRGATLAAIRGLDADVVALQEVHGFQERWLRRRLPGYEVFGQGRDDGRRGERCLVLVRSEALQVESATTRWFGERPDVPGERLPEASFPRVATMAVLSDRATGARFGFVNVHLDEHLEGNRLRSAGQLVGWLDPALSWIVAGDLNSGPGGDVVRVLVEAGLHPALPDDAPGTTHDFTGRTDGPRLDHILAGPEWEVLSTEVVTQGGRRLPSDHWPVVARVRLQNEALPGFGS
jgi:endonuclease/exonuclease/phosphatase family metal-dependent hydrolase